MKNKIKIIDLYNKIANNEEVPKKFTYKGYLWEYDVKNKMWFYYFGESKSHRFDRLFYLNMILNDEVEVLDDEEDNLITLKFGDEVVLTRTNCDDIQGFIISAKGIEPIEDKDIPLIPDDELIILKQEKAIDMQKAIDFNFKVLKEKINQVVEELNKRQ